MAVVGTRLVLGEGMGLLRKLLLVLLASSAACAEQPQLGSTAGQTFEEFKARTYKEPWADGVYIVGGDQPYATDAQLRKLWESLNPGALAVMTDNNADVKWSAAQRVNLTYCVSTRFGSNKAIVEQAILEATRNGWEKFADVKFVHVTAQDATCTASNNAVLFDVNPVAANGQYIARAFFPNDARAVRNVLVDNSAFGNSVPLKNILAHEFGHILGFRHEHIRPEANAPDCVEDSDYRAITSYDSASVMHYPQCNGSANDLSFTQRDKDGAAMLYGAPGAGGTGGSGDNVAPMAQINFPQDGTKVTPTFDVKVQVVDSDLQDVELLIDGESVDVKTAGPFTFKVKSLQLGDHTIDINATDSEGQVTSRSVSITVDPSGVSTGGSNAVSSGQIIGGCSSTPASNGLWLVGLIAFIATRRRYTH